MTRLLLVLTIAVPLTASLVACDPTSPGADPDPYDECATDVAFAMVIDAEVVGDSLIATVAHSGCGQAEVTPCWDGSFMESFPVQVALDLSIGPAEACDAYFEFETEVDLTPLKQAYADGYGSETGSMVLNVDGASILYEF
ncbi:MAG: hypothetical protein ACJATT_002891 [Myxococcota bacterium]|jgi:hypothetical protein